MADVFLSYARDELKRARLFHGLLQDLGLTVFFDVDGLDGGDVFPDVLDREVRSAGAIVSLWSPKALSRQWVKLECTVGIQNNNLIPVAIEEIGPNEVPISLMGRQWIDCTTFMGDTSADEWLKLVKSLARTLERPDLLAREATRHAHDVETHDDPGADAASRQEQPNASRRVSIWHAVFFLLMATIVGLFGQNRSSVPLILSGLFAAGSVVIIVARLLGARKRE